MKPTGIQGIQEGYVRTREAQPTSCEEGYRLACPNNASTRLLHASEHVREVLLCVSGELCFLSHTRPQGTAQGLRVDGRVADCYVSLILAPRTELWAFVGPGAAAGADISWWLAED